MPDIFDRLQPDVFDSVESENNSLKTIKTQLQSVLEEFDNKDRKKEREDIKKEFHKTLTEELRKLKPVQHMHVTNPVVERIKETQIQVPLPIHIPPKIIQSEPRIIERIIKEVEKKDNKKYAEEKSLDNLKKEIEDLKQQLTSVRETLPLGGSGVIGIPAPEGNPDNYVLTISKGKALWKVSSGSGGSSPDIYTTSHVTTTRTLDPTTSTIDNLYNVLASLIVSLQGAGIIQ